MGTTIASAYVQIMPSAEGIKQKLTNVLNDEMPDGDSTGKTFGTGLVSGIKAVVAGSAAAIGALLAAAIPAGADLEQSIGGIETLFKDSADMVIKNAENAYKTAGLSANAYMENITSFSASLLQGLGGDTQKAAKVADMAMTDMFDNANKMGTDMESIQNAYQGFAKQNYTMLDNLKLGYGGTKTEMERLLADAQKLTGVEYDINNLSDVYNAIHVIQGGVDELNGGLGDVNKGLGITGTTAEEAASTISGSFAAVKAAATNVLGHLALGDDIRPSLEALAETAVTFIGGNLLPAVGNVLKGIPVIVSEAFNFVSTGLPALTSAATQLMDSLAQSIQANAPKVIPAAMQAILSFSSTLRENAGKMVDSALNLILTLAQSLIDNIPVFIQTVPTIVTNLAGIINDNAPKLLSAGVQLIVQLGTGLINAIPTLMENIPQIIQAIVSVWQAFNWLDLGKNVISSIKKGIENLKTQLPTTLKNIGNNAVNSIKGISWSTLGKNIITLIKNGIQALVSTIPNALKSIGSKALTSFKGVSWSAVGKAVIKLVGTAISGAASSVVSAAKGVGQKAVSAFKSISWGSLGINIVKGIASGLKSGASAIASAAKSAASKALSAAKSFLGIKSPSRVFRDEVGKNVALGMAEGILGQQKAVSSALNTLTQTPTIPKVDTDWVSAQHSAALAASSTTGTANNQTQTVVVQLTLDGKVIGETTVDYLRERAKQGWYPLTGLV